MHHQLRLTMETKQPIDNQLTMYHKEDNFHPDYFPLTNYIPVEIWRLVAKKLIKQKDTIHIENLSRSSPFFRDLISPSEYLFEKVLAIVGPIIWEKGGLQELPVNDVLKCRAVCSKWNSAVDNLIREKFQRLNWTDEYAPNQETLVVKRAFKSVTHKVKFNNCNVGLDNINKLRSFVRHFELTHPGNQPNGRNPTIWGNLKVSINCEIEGDDEIEGEHLEDYRLYSQRITLLLSKYGTHINKFFVDIVGVGIYEKPEIFQQWFSHMPNLKELKIFSSHHWWATEFQENLELEAYTQAFPFTKLQKLEKLEVVCLPEPVFNQLILQNNHISSLSVSSLKGNYDFLEFPFPNLKQLHMEYNSIEIIAKFCNSQVEWPLESLDINYLQTFDGIIATGGASVAVILQAIQNKFAKTLVSLHFGTDRRDIAWDGPVFDDCKNFRLNLPNLKTMTFFFSGSFVCLDFLLPMQNNLEELTVYYSYDLPVMQQLETIVQFMGFEKRMLDSNVWTIFKKLQKIWVLESHISGMETGFVSGDSMCFCRNEWMKKNENNGK